MNFVLWRDGCFLKMPQPAQTRGLVCRARRVEGVQPLCTLMNPLSAAGTAMLSQRYVLVLSVVRGHRYVGYCRESCYEFTRSTRILDVY
jgi:hypothetical protein